MLLKGKRIFCVEDHIQNRVIFQMIFINHGATVDFERFGKDTLIRLQNISSALDLIILDLMLVDGVSGFDLYDQIKALPRFAATPIIAVSAMDANVAVPKLQQMGFDGFIAKPIDNHFFPKQIAAILKGEKVWHTG